MDMTNSVTLILWVENYVTCNFDNNAIMRYLCQSIKGNTHTKNALDCGHCAHISLNTQCFKTVKHNNKCIQHTQ